MTKQVKHNFFSYFLFVFLILKGVSCVANNLQVLDNIFNNSPENSLQTKNQDNQDNQDNSDNSDNSENQLENQLENEVENEVENELDEQQNINQILAEKYLFYQNKVINNYSAIFKKYSIQYLELTIQPPELL